MKSCGVHTSDFLNYSDYVDRPHPKDGGRYCIHRCVSVHREEGGGQHQGRIPPSQDWDRDRGRCPPYIWSLLPKTPRNLREGLPISGGFRKFRLLICYCTFGVILGHKLNRQINLDKEKQSGERDPCKTIYVVYTLYYKPSLVPAI